MSEPLPAVRLRTDVRPADEAAVMDLVRRTGFFHEPEVLIAGELVRETLEKGRAAGYDFLFADEADADGADRMAGYACYGEIPCTVGSYDVYWIAVDPDRQGRGLGRQLMEAVAAAVRRAGGRTLYLDTSGREQYAPTWRFYERCGFAVAARLADFYGPGDDKLIYARPVAGRPVAASGP